MLRKIVTALIVVPLAAIIIAFAVANRQIVTVSLDPFSAARPAASLTLPLFALTIVLLIVGVLVGGLAAWFEQGKWRRAVRRLEREVSDLRSERNLLKSDAGAGANFHRESTPPERLKLRPPVR